MKHITITIFFVLIGSCSFSQSFINASKARVKKELEAYGTKQKTKATVEETDSTITLLVRDSTKWHLDVIVHFNKSGKGDKTTWISNCDSCITKYMTAILSKDRYKWHKINSVKYISRFSRKLLLEMDNPFKPTSYSISRFRLTRKEYEELITNRACCAEKKQQ